MWNDYIFYYHSSLIRVKWKKTEIRDYISFWKRGFSLFNYFLNEIQKYWISWICAEVSSLSSFCSSYVITDLGIFQTNLSNCFFFFGKRNYLKLNTQFYTKFSKSNDRNNQIFHKNSNLFFTKNIVLCGRVRVTSSVLSLSNKLVSFAVKIYYNIIQIKSIPWLGNLVTQILQIIQQGLFFDEIWWLLGVSASVVTHPLATPLQITILLLRLSVSQNNMFTPRIVLAGNSYQ